MSSLRTILLGLLLVLAAPAFADTVPAGFPSGSLWLSNMYATAGNAVTIYTVVYNSSKALVSGDVVFLVDGSALGTKHFDADPGTTQIVSEPWSATAGTHSFAVQIQNGSAGLTGTTTLPISVSVAPAPPAPAVVTDTIQSANVAQNVVASTTPLVQNIASTVLATTEGVRTAGLTELENLAAAASTTTPVVSNGQVLGTSAYNPQSTTSPVLGIPHTTDVSIILNTSWRSTLGALIFIFSSKLWFYISAVVVLFILYKFVRVAFSDRKVRSRD